MGPSCKVTGPCTKPRTKKEGDAKVMRPTWEERLRFERLRQLGKALRMSLVMAAMRPAAAVRSAAPAV